MPPETPHNRSGPFKVYQVQLRSVTVSVDFNFLSFTGTIILVDFIYILFIY